MKKLLLILLIPMIGFGQNVSIPDANFKAYLVGEPSINTNGDNEIQVSEATAFSGTIDCSNMNISDLTGIEDFTNLTHLICPHNNISSLDLTNNTALIKLECFYNQISLLDVSNNVNLTELVCNGNNLSNLDISNNVNLTELLCGQNNLSNLDISNNVNLTSFQTSNNQLTSLDVSQNIALTGLWCYSNQLTSLDLSNNISLTTLWCYSNQLTSLDVSSNINLKRLWSADNLITSLDLSNTSIEVITNEYIWPPTPTNTANFYNNPLSIVSLANNPFLTTINITNTFITCLDISALPTVSLLDCSNNLLEQLNTKNGNFNNMYVNALNNNLACAEVDNIGQATNNWSFDSFTTLTTNCNYTNLCATVTSIQEHSTNKELLKITDLLGRETKEKKNTPLFYIYDDGTVEKRITID